LKVTPSIDESFPGVAREEVELVLRHAEQSLVVSATRVRS
jgi:hypothetical protein